MNEDKIFMNGIFIREKQFENGGSIIKCEIVNVFDFADQLKKHAKSDGKITLEIKSRREKAENGLTHYCEVSKFVPQQQTNKQSQNVSTNQNKFHTSDDDMPF